MVAIGGHPDHARNLDRDHHAIVVDGSELRSGVIGTRRVKGRVRQIVGLVSLGRDDHRPLLHGKPNSPLFGFPDRALDRIVLAVEKERIREITVVCDVDMMGSCPHKGAHHRLWEKEASGVTGLDRRNPDVGGHADDADAVGGSGDRAGGMGAMAIVVLGGQAGDGNASDAVDAVTNVDVLPKVRVIEVDAGIDVSREDRRTTTRNCVGLGSVDLTHVPLQW